MKTKQKKPDWDKVSDHPIVKKKLDEANAMLRRIDRSKLESLLKGDRAN